MKYWFNYRGPATDVHDRTANIESAACGTAAEVPTADGNLPEAAEVADEFETEAYYKGPQRVRVREDAPGRWQVWVTAGGPWKRQTDFVSPSVRHAKQAVEQWYGPPPGGWHVPEQPIDGELEF